jgi:secondary thiamine-phosphate synthase enzyme
MRQAAGSLDVHTAGRGLTEITDQVGTWAARQEMTLGLLTQENASPAVRADLEAFFERIAPEDKALYLHDDEGPDDMPAHLRSALTCVQLSIPLVEGRLALGTWQGVFLFEHRRKAHTRQIALHLLGA